MVRKIRDTLIGLWPILKAYIPRRSLVIAVVLAFLVGLVWSYRLDPIVFYDGDPSSLGQSWQDQWVRMIADSYALRTQNAAPTDELIQNTITLLQSVDNPTEIVDRLGLTEIRQLAEQAEPFAASAPQPNDIVATVRPFILGPVVVAALTIVLSLLFGFYINPMVVEPLRKRLRGKQGVDSAGQAKLSDVRQARQIAEQLKKQEPTEVSAFGPPVSRHVSIYAPGRAYDDSFSIEDASRDDEFLGECGAVISETIGVGDQEKVTAVEVWLFDKEDFVRTLTGVFVSEYAYNDPAIRSKLEPKGELMIARPGAALVLETNTLRMQARVVDVTYGSGPLPPNSYFDKLTLELLAWRKTGAAAGAPAPQPVTYAPPRAPTFGTSTPAVQPPPTPAYMPPPAPPAAAPAAPATYGGGLTPLKPPPLQMPPAAPQRPPARDDDPFGGTGDWTPLG